MADEDEEKTAKKRWTYLRARTKELKEEQRKLKEEIAVLREKLGKPKREKSAEVAPAED